MPVRAGRPRPVRLRPRGWRPVREEPADLGDDLGAGQVGRVAQPANQGAADDQAVGDRGQRPDLLGRADPEADADRQVGLGAEPGDVLGQLGREALPLAGDPGDRDIVDEPGRRRGRSGSARSRGVVGVMSWISRRSSDRRLPAECLRLLDRQVGDDQAVDPGGDRLAEVAVHAPAVDDRVRDHRHQRRRPTAARWRSRPGASGSSGRCAPA